MCIRDRSSGAQDEYQFITNKIEQMMTEKYKSEELMQEHQTLLNLSLIHIYMQEKPPEAVRNTLLKTCMRIKCAPLSRQIILLLLR